MRSELGVPPNLKPPAPKLNPDVTPETLVSTVCVSGWTTIVRRSFFTSQRVKGEMLKAIGGPNASTYVLDHIVPLCLGGSPNDPSNLQLQLWAEIDPQGSRRGAGLPLRVRRQGHIGRSARRSRS